MSSPTMRSTTPLSTPTPADLTITPRDRRFGRALRQDRWWVGDDPFGSTFLTALSITFPQGEAMFIDAVRAHRDGVPEKLASEIRAFIQQEVIHSREHVAFNRKAAETGYDFTRIQAQVDEVMDLIRDRPSIVNLAATIALEHYTATMAKQFLTDPAMLDGADTEWAAMWRWHAIEEIEHKGVAYDTWLYATRDWSRWRRWKLKSVMMSVITLNFWKHRIEAMLDLLEQDGITGWRARWGIARYLLGKPGTLRKLIPDLVAYYLPRFHPWNEDDRALIGKVDSDYAAARLSPGAAPA